ncbi:hypothetical protein ACFOOK_27965 [Micromonospora krabiensis]|uniref:hypothetical protein n=1 Tax=Micromonospora krabiensis TaxID=307121 RepID=UPI0012FE75C4
MITLAALAWIGYAVLAATGSAEHPRRGVLFAAGVLTLASVMAALPAPAQPGTAPAAAGVASVPPAAGRTYLARAAQREVVALAHASGDADTIALPTTMTLEQVAIAVREARMEGYAEGYVDGIARRHDSESGV